MDAMIMKDSFYLVQNETYEAGKRIKLAKELSDWYKQKEPKNGYPKVKVALKDGMFILLNDDEDATPRLVCTQGFIEFV